MVWNMAESKPQSEKSGEVVSEKKSAPRKADTRQARGRRYLEKPLARIDI